MDETFRQVVEEKAKRSRPISAVSLAAQSEASSTAIGKSRGPARLKLPRGARRAQSVSPRSLSPTPSETSSRPTSSRPSSRPTSPNPKKKASSKAKAAARHADEAKPKAKKEKQHGEPRPSVDLDPDPGITKLRSFFSEQFGGLEEAFAALDTDGSGKITFGQLQSAFETLNVSPWEATGGVDILRVFKELDYDGTMDLDLFKLMESDAATRLKNKADKAGKKGQKDKASKAAKKQALKVDDLKGPEERSERPMRKPRVFEKARDADAWPPKEWIAQHSEWMRKIIAFGKDLEQEELNLAYGFIGARGVGQLIETLTVLPGMRMITELNLFGNYIGSVGTFALADTLEKKVSLQRLNLGKNGIGDDGAVRLAESVMKIHVLEELLLENNRIGDRGASQLADVISKGPPSLMKLDLVNNCIDQKGMKSFVVAFDSHRIPCVMLDGNIAEAPYLPEPVIVEETEEAEVQTAPSLCSSQCVSPHSPPTRTLSSPTSPHMAASLASPRRPASSLRRQGSRTLSKNGSKEAKLSPLTKTIMWGPPGSCPWTADIAHKLKPRKDTKKGAWLPQAGPRPPDSPEHRTAFQAASYVPGSVMDSWPAALSLSKALEEAALLGQGKLSRPASEGAMVSEATLRRRGEPDSFSEDSWGRSDSIQHYRSFAGR